MKKEESIKQESGRSMVEMLGVLAVIGVLSLGGISAYTSAMAKYKANEVAQSVSTAYMWMQAEQFGGDFMPVSGVEFKSQPVTGAGDNAYIAIGFGDDIAACKQLKTMYEGHKDFLVKGNCE